MSFDNVCKLLAEKYPLDFARWLLPEEPREIKVLKTELSIEPIRADFAGNLFRITLAQLNNPVKSNMRKNVFYLKYKEMNVGYCGNIEKG